MNNLGRILIAALVVSLALPSLAGAHDRTGTTVSREFANVSRIELNTVSGDCIVRKGEAGRVLVEIDNRMEPENGVDFKFDQHGDRLEMEEDIVSDRTRGSVTWVLVVPDGIEIRFSSASGDMSVSELSGRFEGSVASGDIEFVNCSGEFEASSASGDQSCSGCRGTFHLSAASGDCDLSDCKGGFEVSTASGDVDALSVSMDAESAFSTASGDVEVVLAGSLASDLSIGTASGDATLDCDANEISGRVELTCKKRGGNIVSSFDFDEEAEYKQHGETYLRKSFTKGTGTHEIRIGTASGEAIIRK